MAQAHRTLVHLAGPTSLFRPPYGGQNHLTYFFARLLGLTVVTWNRSADDWIQQSAESAAQRATQGLTGGDVVLMHDGLELKPGEPVIDIDRPAMVDSFLQQAAARGLRSVTVGDLLSRGVPSRTRWIR
jgi:peptidoglycan/xylan/chitin deacetylase (PgdA/CDA1 family)